MAIPRPGRPVRGSQSGAPIMALFDLMGRRWAMGIIWNLANGAMSFGELEAVCESISPTILTRRLRDLREAGLIRLVERRYELTPVGQELLQMLKPLGTFARRWGRALDSK